MISFNSLYYYNLSYPKNLLVDNLLYGYALDEVGVQYAQKATTF